MPKRLLALLEVAGFLPAWNDMSLILVLEHTDDEELSSQWEDAYFGDDEVCPLAIIECLTVSDSMQVAQALNAKAVVLRLTAGSQEAGFLAPFCPISKFPTVILIKCA